MSESINRLSRYFRALVDKATELLPYAASYPYSVVSCDVGKQTVSARSLDSTMPDLTDIPMGSDGLFLKLSPGAQIMVGFRGLGATSYYVSGYSGGGDAVSVENVVFLGWLGLAQAPPPGGVLTVTVVPYDTLPPPVPEIAPGTPTPLSLVPAYVRLYGKVLAEKL